MTTIFIIFQIGVILVLALNLVGMHRKWKKKYNALETGADEQQEGYEQEYLEWDENLAGLRNIIETQADFALEQNTTINDLLVEKQRLESDAIGRNRYVIELEDIVERHRHNCLPDLANLGDIHG